MAFHLADATLLKGSIIEKHLINQDYSVIP